MTRYADAGRILVVDDEPANIALVSRLMKRFGYEISTAPNGEEGLEAVARVRPDVILLDVNMPRTRWLRGVPAPEGRRRHAPDPGRAVDGSVGG